MTLKPYTTALIAHIVAHTHITDCGAEGRTVLRGLPRFAAVFDTRSRIASVAWARWQLRPRRYYGALPGFLLNSSRPPGAWTRPRHIGERAMALASAALGAEAERHGALPFSDSARQALRGLVPSDRPAIGLAVGSREARKNWPLNRFAELAVALSAGGFAPVFFIGPKEAAWRRELEARAPGAPCLDFNTITPNATLGPLDPVLAALDAVELVVANDGGLGHLAAAMDRPVVSLFGPTDPARWAPMARQRIVIRAQDFGGETMDAIPVAPVVRAVRDLLRQTAAMS